MGTFSPWFSGTPSYSTYSGDIGGGSLLSNRPGIKDVQKSQNSTTMVAMPKNTTVVNQTVQRPQQQKKDNTLNNIVGLSKMVKQYMDAPTDITGTGPSTPGYSVGMDLSGETAIMKSDAAGSVPNPATIGAATGQNAGVIAATTTPDLSVGSGTALQAGLKATSPDWGTLGGVTAKETGIADTAVDIVPNTIMNPGNTGSIFNESISANIHPEAFIGARPTDYFSNFMPVMSPGVMAAGIGGTIAGMELGKWASRELDVGGEKEGKAFGGVLGGATAGAGAGAMMGGIGAIPGAVTGGLLGGIGQIFSIF